MRPVPNDVMQRLERYEAALRRIASTTEMGGAGEVEPMIEEPRNPEGVELRCRIRYAEDALEGA